MPDMTEIKICGIYRDEDTGYINDAKPDYFGMIINFPKSHRNVSPERAGEIRRQIRPKIPAVGVFVNQPKEEIAALLENGTIDIAQLHGQESEDEILFLQKTGKPVWKAFKIRSSEDMAKARLCRADRILLDNGYGTGQTFDWNLVGEPGRPFILAGGLTPENIPEAIRYLHPDVLDISSGVETEKKKDYAKICAAVKAARNG